MLKPIRSKKLDDLPAKSQAGGVVPALLIRIAGKLIGRGLQEALGEMSKAQWLPANELQRRAEDRLIRLLKHASRNVPFYRDLFQQLSLTQREPRSINDLSMFPIMSKVDYREHKAEDFYATDVPCYNRVERKTSGSTGVPFQFCLDRRALPTIFASHLFYDGWHGLNPFDRYIRISSPAPTEASLPRGTPVSVRLNRLFARRLQGFYESLTQERILVWEVDSNRAQEIWRRMEAFRPKFVMGYTSSLAAIADELLRLDRRLSSRIRGVIAIAETLSPTRRRLIEEYFCAPIINRYGLREFGTWSAQSCPESPHQFHINTELVVCEILREDGSPCSPGERGRVVLTDLHNYVRPFIRYNTGDLAVLGTDHCACGRGFPLIGEIDGRSTECLRTPSGKEISPSILGHYLFVYNDHLEFVRHYQLVQESPHLVCLSVVPNSGWSKHRRERLQSDLKHLIGEDMQVSVRTVDRIESEKGGKRPIIKILSPPGDQSHQVKEVQD